MLIALYGEDLKRLRLKANRTTDQAARVAGVSRATYENWEKGVGKPKGDQTLELFVSFKVPGARQFVEALKSSIEKVRQSGIGENERAKRRKDAA